MGSIELKSVEKWFGSAQVIKGVDLKIECCSCVSRHSNVRLNTTPIPAIHYEASTFFSLKVLKLLPI